MNLIKSFIRAQAGNLIAKASRYLATAVGGYVASHHLISNSDLVNELTGFIMAAGPWLWSAYNDYVDHRDGYDAKAPANTVNTNFTAGTGDGMGKTETKP